MGRPVFIITPKVEPSKTCASSYWRLRVDRWEKIIAISHQTGANNSEVIQQAIDFAFEHMDSK